MIDNAYASNIAPFPWFIWLLTSISTLSIAQIWQTQQIQSHPFKFGRQNEWNHPETKILSWHILKFLTKMTLNREWQFLIAFKACCPRPKHSWVWLTPSPAATINSVCFTTATDALWRHRLTMDRWMVFLPSPPYFPFGLFPSTTYAVSLFLLTENYGSISELRRCTLPSHSPLTCRSLNREYLSRARELGNRNPLANERERRVWRHGETPMMPLSVYERMKLAVNMFL